MARKVFISVLGTGFYRKCKYAAGSFVSTETTFVQDATLSYLRAEEWPVDSKAFILLTDKARNDNWDVSSGERKDPATNVVVPYKGLHQVLDEKGLPFSISDISIPDGKNEKEMWTIFETVFKKLEDGDELFFDLTHSFRYLPMLMLVLGNYAKFLRNAVVCSITYGNFEARSRETNEAPIVDLLPLSTLQDWTFATADYLKNGYADRLVELSNEGLRPLLKSPETQRDGNVKGLRDLVKHIDSFSSEIQTCRGMDIIASQSAENIAADVRKLQEIVIPQLEPVLEKIMVSIKGFSASETILNMFSAAQWCYNNHLYQQSITFLEEGVVSFFCQRHGIPLNCRDKRELVTSAFSILSYSLPVEEWRVKPDSFVVLQAIVNDINTNFSSLVKLFNSVVALRNDYNHCGMRENSSMPIKIKKNIKTRLDSIKLELFPDSVDHNREEEPSAERFINLTNHPSPQWDEQQTEAAKLYGTIMDMPFPEVNPDDAPEDVKALADAYAQKIEDMAEDFKVTVHIMGEMTFVYNLVSRLKAMGIRCVASTTVRQVTENPDGTKMSEFSFVRFREY